MLSRLHLQSAMGGQELTSCPGCRYRDAITKHRHCNLLHPDGSGLLILTLLSLRRGLLAVPAVRLAVPVPSEILGECLVGHVVLSASGAKCEGWLTMRNVRSGGGRVSSKRDRADVVNYLSKWQSPRNGGPSSEVKERVSRGDGWWVGRYDLMVDIQDGMSNMSDIPKEGLPAVALLHHEQ